MWPSVRTSSTSVRRVSASSSTTTTRSARGGAFAVKDASVCGISLTARRLYPASCDLYNAQQRFVDRVSRLKLQRRMQLSVGGDCKNTTGDDCALWISLAACAAQF